MIDALPYESVFSEKPELLTTPFHYAKYLRETDVSYPGVIFLGEDPPGMESTAVLGSYFLALTCNPERNGTLPR